MYSLQFPPTLFAIDFRYLPLGTSHPEKDADAFAPLTKLVTDFEEESHPLSLKSYVEFANEFLETVGNVPQYTYPDPLFERAFALVREHNPDACASNAFLRNYSQQSRARVLDDANEWLATTKTDIAEIEKQQALVESGLEAGTVSYTQGFECERQLDQQRIDLLSEQRWVKDVLAYVQERAADVEEWQYYRPDLAVAIELGGSAIAGAPAGYESFFSGLASSSPPAAPTPLFPSHGGSPAVTGKRPLKRARQPSPAPSANNSAGSIYRPCARRSTVAPSPRQSMRLRHSAPSDTDLGAVAGPSRAPVERRRKASRRAGPSSPFQAIAIGVGFANFPAFHRRMIPAHQEKPPPLFRYVLGMLPS